MDVATWASIPARKPASNRTRQASKQCATFYNCVHSRASIECFASPVGLRPTEDANHNKKGKFLFMAPTGIPRLTEAGKIRFWKKVYVGAKDECWPLRKVTRSDGYGRIRVNGEKHYAHRVAFVAAGNTFEDGPYVRHVVCANRQCCNPRHLASGTKQDNADDRERDGNTSRGPRHSQIMSVLNRARAKLSDQKAREIRAKCCATGLTQREIAAMYGVCQSLVSGIARGCVGETKPEMTETPLRSPCEARGKSNFPLP